MRFYFCEGNAVYYFVYQNIMEKNDSAQVIIKAGYGINKGLY
jgi:hypothetical protein